MAKALFLSLPLHGHTNPSLAIVRELVARGEEVIYYSAGAFAAKIEQTGALYRPYRNAFLADIKQLPERMEELSWLLMQVTEDLLAHELEGLRAERPDYLIVDSVAPWGQWLGEALGVPVVTSHSTFALNRHVLKYAVSHGVRPKSPRMVLSKMRYIAKSIWLGRRLSRRHGIKGPGVIGLVFGRSDCNIVYTSRLFQPFAETFDERFQFVGPTIGSPSVGPTIGPPSVGPTIGPPSVGPTIGLPSVGPTIGLPSVGPTIGSPSVGPTIGLPSVGPTIGSPSVGPTIGSPSVGPTIGPPSVGPTIGLPSVGPTIGLPSVGPTVDRPAARPTVAIATDTAAAPQKPALVYISLGTLFNADATFYRNCFEAFRDMDVQVIMSIGSNVSAASLGQAPPNFSVQTYVAQLEVLERASVFVTHGGMNSVSEGLFYGVPLVVIPQMGEQETVGRRVEELGAGLYLAKREATAARLRESVERVLADGAFHQQAAVVRASFDAAGGAARAAEAVIAFIGR